MCRQGSRLDNINDFMLLYYELLSDSGFFKKVYGRLPGCPSVTYAHNLVWKQGLRKGNQVKMRSCQIGVGLLIRRGTFGDKDTDTERERL